MEFRLFSRPIRKCTNEIYAQERAVISQQFNFPGSQNHELAGLLEEPAEGAVCYALFAHCFTCSKNIAVASRISRTLVSHGIGVLRFDFTGLGNSEGDFSNTHFSSNTEDLVRAAQFMESKGKKPVVLIGHSLGGAAVLSAAAKISSSKFVATIAAPSDPYHVSHLLGDKIPLIERSGEAVVHLEGREFTIRKEFLEDIEEQNLLQQVRKMEKALVVFHSPVDQLVGIDHARKIFEAAIHPKSFVSLDQADHMLSSKADCEYVAEVIAAWVERYL